MNNQKAFTLIELLVVVLIIGILAAVALPQYQKAVMKSRYATLKNMTQSILDAQKIYYLANGTYATDFDELSLEPGGTIENDAKDYRYFPWGVCEIQNTYNYCQCKNDQITMWYRLYYDGRRRRCGTWMSLSLQKQICQQETGDTAPTTSDNSTLTWYYYQ